jgi:hypothetical protein
MRVRVGVIWMASVYHNVHSFPEESRNVILGERCKGFHSDVIERNNRVCSILRPTRQLPCGSSSTSAISADLSSSDCSASS